MKITKITQQKRTDRYNLFSGEEFVIGLSGAVLIQTGISVGSEISEDDLRGIAAKDDYSKALAKAYDYLSRRLHSTKELADKLTAKEYPEPIIVKVTEHLTETGYLNDAEFAEQWIRNRSRSRGRRLLEQELRQKGISEEVFAGVFAKSGTEDDSLERARGLALKRYQTLRDEPWRTVYARLGGYLARRGFSSDDVRTILAEINRAHPRC